MTLLGPEGKDRRKPFEKFAVAHCVHGDRSAREEAGDAALVVRARRCRDSRGMRLDDGWAFRGRWRPNKPYHARWVMMNETYTHSTWRVKPGLEEEFVRRWEELADWSGLQGLSARAKLLRDTDDPSCFVSFGPWGSMDAVRRWRGAPGFHERVARLQEVLDGLEPKTLELVSER